MYQTSAMAIGTLISLMLFANGSLQTAFGATLSILILHAIGTVVLIAILLLKGASFRAREKIAPYLFFSGALGVVLIFLNNTTVSSIGLTLTIALGIIGQLIVSTLIDHFGFFNLEKRRANPKKVLGFVLISAGIAVMAWPKG